jgi:hypothetical protein
MADEPAATAVVPKVAVWGPAQVRALAANGEELGECPGTPPDDRCLHTTVISAALPPGVANSPAAAETGGQDGESSAFAGVNAEAASQPHPAEAPRLPAHSTAEVGPARPPPLTTTDPATVSADLKKLWCQWGEVVHALARAPEQFQVDDQAYRGVHRQLLQQCRAEQEHSGGAKERVLRVMENLVEPWLTPATLERADRDTRDILLLRCQELSHELGLKRGSTGRWVWGVLLLAGALAGAAAFLLLR